MFAAIKNAWPEEIFFRGSIDLKSQPGVYQSLWYPNQRGGFFPDFEVALQFDAFACILGGTVAFLYSYLSRDVSYGKHYVWPCSGSLYENLVPISRIYSFIRQAVMSTTVYSYRFLIGGFVFHGIRTGTFWTFRKLLGVQGSGFRLAWLSSSLYAWLWTSSYTTKVTSRRSYKFWGGLWVGLLMAFADSVFDEYLIYSF